MESKLMEKNMKRRKNSGSPFRFAAYAVLILVLLMAVVPQLFTGYDPLTQDMTALLQPPSAAHFFGTDRSEEHTSELQSHS